MGSIWTKTVTLPAFSRLEGHVQADAAVIGGGITGLLTALVMFPLYYFIYRIGQIGGYTWKE